MQPVQVWYLWIQRILNCGRLPVNYPSLQMTWFRYVVTYSRIARRNICCLGSHLHQKTVGIAAVPCSLTCGPVHQKIANQSHDLRGIRWKLEKLETETGSKQQRHTSTAPLSTHWGCSPNKPPNFQLPGVEKAPKDASCGGG